MLEAGTLYNTGRPFADVKAFGAAGDGRTDDTAAILRAVRHAQDNGLDLKFSGGTYRISRQITFVNWQNANVFAENATIVAAPGYRRSAPLEGMLEFTGAQNVKVFGFAIDGNEPAFPDSETFLHAIRFKSSNRVEVAFNRTERTVGNGLNFSDTDNPVVHHNTIRSYWHGGIEFKRSANLYVGYNDITGTGNKGTTANMRNDHVSGGTSGILITGTATGGDTSKEPPHSGALVERNIIRNSAGGGIKIEDQNDVQVLYNEVHDFGKDGIKVHPINQAANPARFVHDAVIRGNVVSGFKNWRGDGSGYIVLQSVRNGTVEDNLILGNEGEKPAVVPTWKYEYGVRVNPFLGWGLRPENVTVRNNRIYGTRVPVSLEGGATTLRQAGNTIDERIPGNIDKPLPGDGNGGGNPLPDGGGGDGGGTPPAPLPVTISGSSGRDVLYGNRLDNTILAAANDDTAFGAAGNDSIAGDAGNDLLFGDDEPVETIMVRVAGDRLDTEGARFRVLVDGRQVGDTQEVTAVLADNQKQTFTFRLREPVTAASVAIEFLNDGYRSPTEDRNLWIDQLTVNDTALSPASGEYRVQDETTPRPGRNLLHRNGSLVFSLSSGSAGNDVMDGGDGSDRLYGGDGNDMIFSGDIAAGGGVGDGRESEIVIRVSGDHYNGAPEFSLKIDGKVIKAENVVNARRTAGQVQEFRFRGAYDLDKASQVQLQMTNDAWGGSKDRDRNIYVHEVSINGRRLKGENARYRDGGGSMNVFRNGTNFVNGSGLLMYNLAEIPPRERVFAAAGGDNSGSDNVQDTLAGGRGNDVLVGNRGNDTYLFAAGDGQDTLNNQGSSDDTRDVVRFGDGVRVNQMVFWRKDADLLIGLTGTEDRLLLQDWFGDTANRVDTFVLSDGRALAANDVQQLVDAMSSFEHGNGAALPALPANLVQGIENILAAVWK